MNREKKPQRNQKKKIEIIAFSEQQKSWLNVALWQPNTHTHTQHSLGD